MSSGLVVDPTPPAEVAGFAVLERMLQRHLGVSGQVALEEISRHSNLNYVYRARAGNRSLYLKVVPERPRRLPIQLPRERVFAEAKAIGFFGQFAGSHVVVPEVLFVDETEFVLAMSDVGEGRQVLLDVIDSAYRSCFLPSANALGTALGLVHSGTRGLAQFRPAAQDQLLRGIVFAGLIAPGAQAVFPELAGKVISEMNGRRECLVHADLWGKNILVGEGMTPAIVDFEGAFLGDPSFDVATVLAVSLLPALAQRVLLVDAMAFAAAFTQAYGQAYAPRETADSVLGRAFFYLGAMIAARGFGPFAYPMSEEAKGRLCRVARDLTERPPASALEYATRISN